MTRISFSMDCKKQPKIEILNEFWFFYYKKLKSNECIEDE